MEIEIPINQRALFVELIRKWQGVSTIANEHSQGSLLAEVLKNWWFWVMLLDHVWVMFP